MANSESYQLIQQAKVNHAIHTCTKCHLSSSCRSPVSYSGPVPNSIAVVGEAPGYQEDRNGIPFIGPAGTLLRRWLGSIGIDNPTYLNAVCCYPPDRNNAHTPTLDEVRKCRGNLEMQLAVIKPSFILVFGNVALSSWWPKIKVGEIRQRFWKAGWDSNRSELSDGWSWGYATFHPAAALRTRLLEKDIMEDLFYFRSVLSSSQDIPVCDICVKCKKEGVMEQGGIWYCDRHRVDVSRTGPVRFRHLPPLGTVDVELSGQERLL